MRHDTDKGYIADQGEDIPVADLPAFARLALDRVCQDIQARLKLRARHGEQSWFEREATALRANLEAVVASDNASTREAALKGIIEALSLGYYHAGGGQIVKELQLELRREMARPARDERDRKNAPLREIVERRLGELLREQPGLQGHARPCAVAIYDNVAEDVVVLGREIPRWGKIGSESDQKLKDRRTDRIRKLIIGIW